MSAPAVRRLCLVSRLGGFAGPASFQRRLTQGLAGRGIDVCYDLNDRPYAAVLVSGGTRHLAGLSGARRQGIPVFQRLDGKNWIHRRRRTGVRHYLRAEFNNLLLRLLRRRLADGVIYQSRFVRDWWERSEGPLQVPTFVVHNGVPLDIFTPGERAAVQAMPRMLVVEANLSGGYEIGLEHAVSLLNAMAGHVKSIGLVVAGRVPAQSRRAAERRARSPIQWLGEVEAQRLPALYASGALLFSADLQAACPNSVLESMACATPVVAFETGALPEIVTEESGRLAAYGADAWRLEPPAFEGLARAAAEVLADPSRYRGGARLRAEAAFGLERMIDGYLSALGWAG